jgi:2'-hydroxyisoflavone reductase
MRLLILGGTWFLGRALAELAVQDGWEVTTFSRGLHGRDVPGTAPVRGDREQAGDLTRLAASGEWDAVTDTSGYTPETVQASVRALRGRANRYVYVSTVNAYRGWPAELLTDESPVYEASGPGARPASESARYLDAVGVEYGQLKAACERAVDAAWAGSYLILRPGVILGRYEYVGRLPWLLRRMERGGQGVGPASGISAFAVH